MDDEVIGLRAFGKLVGVSLTAIQKAIDSGRINAVVQTPKGRKLLKLPALDEWNASRIPGNNNRWGEIEEGLGDFDEELDSETGAEGVDGKDIAARYTIERTKLVIEQRKRTALERRELEGELHRAIDVEIVWSEMLSRFRTRILAMPAKLAPIIAAFPKPDPARVQGELESAVREALSELAEHDGEKIARQRAKRVAKA